MALSFRFRIAGNSREFLGSGFRWKDWGGTVAVVPAQAGIQEMLLRRQAKAFSTFGAFWVSLERR